MNTRQKLIQTYNALNGIHVSGSSNVKLLASAISHLEDILSSYDDENLTKKGGDENAD